MNSKRAIIILDWDGTITKSDTLAALAFIAQDHTSEETQVSTSRLSQSWWQEVVDAYLTDFRAHKSTYTPAAEHRSTIEAESAWLQSLAKVERASFDRAKATGRFDGITQDMIERQVSVLCSDGVVQLRDGWHEILQLDAHVAIVSVNWSRKFIRACLRHVATHNSVTASAKKLLLERIDGLDIMANEIFDTNSRIGDNKRIHTSRDKADAVREILARYDANIPSIYVGDSATDFDSLLAVDHGICIRDPRETSGQRELTETLGRIGSTIRPLSQHEKSSVTASKAASASHMWWTDSIDIITSKVSEIMVRP